MVISKPKVSDTMRRYYHKLPQSKQMDHLTFGYDIEIKVRPSKAEVGNLILVVC